MISTLTPLDRFVSAAKAAGCPADQLRNFRRGNYAAQPKQLAFSAAARECDEPGGPVRIGLGGSRGTAKSHAALAQVGLDDCPRIPRLKFLFLRNIGKAARESFEDLVYKVLRHAPAQYVPSRSRLLFDNDSFIVLGGFHSESDIDKYLGIEYDGMVIEDAHLVSQSKIDRLFGSLRTSKDNWRPRAYLTFNPGGVNHAWLKRTFVDPWRANRETDTRYIHTTPGDNRFIDPEYYKYLSGLTGWLRRAWFDGDWDIVAGQFFTNFRHDTHVLPPARQPFQQIPANWPVWGSLDYGHAHPTSAHLHTTGDGIIYTVGEHWAQRTPIKRHAEALKDLCQRWGRTPRYWYAGQDCFARRESEEDSPTIAEKYKREGITLEPANVNRISGWSEMSDRLGDIEQGIEPRWFIFDSCPRLIECLPTLEHDPNRPEDVLKVDIDENGQGGDDAADDCRMGLLAAPRRKFSSLASGKAKGWNPL
jgi:phage terminase large subunit